MPGCEHWNIQCQKTLSNRCSTTIENDNGRLISMRHEHISPKPRPKRADESDCRLSNGLEMWRHALWTSSCLSIQCRVLLERQTSRAVSFFCCETCFCCSNFKLKSSSEWSKDPLKIYSCSCLQIEPFYRKNWSNAAGQTESSQTFLSNCATDVFID